MDTRKRIAIYGGTFDPVHLGHLEVARKVVQIFDIDELLFVPARHAPHKLEQEVTAPLHRYSMLVLASQDEPQMFVSTFEMEARDRQYTVNTLEHFRSTLGQNTDLFFIMGADSWAEITSWREWQRLPTLANIIVVTRPGYHLRLDHVTPEIAARVIDLRGPGSALKQSAGPGDAKVFLTDAVMIDISATEIRSEACAGRTEKLTKVLPAAVADYIVKYRLYRNRNEA
jgi:nicotinate-nucleotide adenylyltransferase